MSCLLAVYHVDLQKQRTALTFYSAAQSVGLQHGAKKEMDGK